MVVSINAVTGGLLLGISAVLLLLFTGKIAGVSGIVGGLFNKPTVDVIWRILFLCGLIFGGWLGASYFGGSIATEYANSPWQLGLAGLFVGIGSTIGNGCTSGHGICGIGRFSGRSIMATLTFMSVAIVTVFVLRHVVGV
ncbi:YeeE/YedE family protein [Ferrimonas lipolytica]|uniref:YeeE/YedE family protein n=2 Tax=Ferrimonas lipolytica TaxID=2724191 RepID=A0A6H1UM96_9GAMM|nr:YeeE/YedE family protein [Ferrimonas lipolytica]